MRCFEKHPHDRVVRFAHTNPVHIEVANKPLRPRKAETEYMIRRMQEELHRNRGVLDPASFAGIRNRIESLPRNRQNSTIAARIPCVPDVGNEVLARSQPGVLKTLRSILATLPEAKEKAPTGRNQPG